MNSYVRKLSDVVSTSKETAARDGNPMLDRLYRLHWDELCRQVRKMFGAGPPEPEDVVQMAFARFATLERPEAVANPRAFLFQCVRNIVLDHRRHEAVARAAHGDVALFEIDDGSVDLNAERVLSSKQRLAIVEAAVRRMEPKRRRVLIMHAIHGLGYTEIARRMGLSPTRVTQIFERAVLECEHALRAADGTTENG